jgi:putative transposase
VYLKGYTSVGELMIGLTEYFVFYNGERPHQALGQRTPDVVYRTAEGGGAVIVDKFPRPAEEAGSEAKPGQRRAAAIEVECAA